VAGCDEAFWAARPGGRPAKVEDRQRAVFALAHARLAEDLRDEGLPDDPDFATFVERLHHGRQVSRPARGHTRAIPRGLRPRLPARSDGRPRGLAVGAAGAGGGDPARERHRESATENTPGAERRDDRPTPARADRLRAAAAPDYAWLDGLDDPDAALARLARRRPRPLKGPSAPPMEAA
jgi:hypothetical protein